MLNHLESTLHLYIQWISTIKKRLQTGEQVSNVAAIKTGNPTKYVVIATADLLETDLVFNGDRFEEGIQATKTLLEIIVRCYMVLNPTRKLLKLILFNTASKPPFCKGIYTIL